MTHSFAQDRKRVERRHHRMDADLQARARPFSLIRKDFAKEIRQLVERQDEDSRMDRRLLLGGGDSTGNDGSSSSQGSGSQRGGGEGGDGSSTGNSGTGTGNGSLSGGDSGDRNSGGTGSSFGGGNSGSQTGTGTSTGSNTGDSGDRSGTGSGSDTGLGSKGDDTTSSSSSSSSSSKPKGILGGLESVFHHSSTTSSSSSSSSSTPTSTSTSSTSTISMTPSTSVAYVTPTAATPTLNNAAAASATPSDTSDNGPGAGLIIGIVAGALAGVAVLAALIGFLIKKFGRKEDPYETDPFDSDEFRRQSAMLPDTFDDLDHNPEMSEMNHHNNMSPFNDEMEYAAAGAAGAGAASAFTARNESGGPRPPTMFQKHMNAPAAQLSVGDAPPVPVIGAVYNPNGHDPSPQLPPMAFGGSDPYSMAGVGRPNFDSNINNPYGYLDRQFSGSRSSPQEKFVDAPQGYADLDRTGSDGSMHGKSAGQMYAAHENDDFRSYDYHDTAGRPGTAEGRSGTPDLPNVQQTYAMADDHESDSRVQSPNRQMVASPTHLSQDFLSNGGVQQYQQFSQQQSQQQQQYSHDQYNNYQHSHSESPSPPSQPLQVRNLLPNPHLAVQQQGGQRPVSGVSSVADDEAAYGGVW